PCCVGAGEHAWETWKMRKLTPVLVCLLITSVQVVPAAAKTLGMVAATDGTVTVFDADSDTVVGTPLVLPGAEFATGRCSITADQTRGFVPDFTFHIHVVDLTRFPPTAASGTNPIHISNAGEATAISPDGQFLVVCDGSSNDPISVIDIANQTQVSTF